MVGLTTAKTSCPCHLIYRCQSRNCHIVQRLTHRSAIKVVSKVANHELVDQQACSLLQYINVIANIFIMRNYLINCAEKNRANNLLQCIHQVTIELGFRNSLTQERFKSDLEFRYQIIVLLLNLRKGFAKLRIPIVLFRKLIIYCGVKSETFLDALANRMIRS